MNKGVSFSTSGRTLTAILSSEIDHHIAKRIRESVDERLFKEKPEEVRLDFSGVSFMDSSGIGIIIGRKELCDSIGARLRITGLSASLRKLVKLSGIEKLSGIVIE